MPMLFSSRATLRQAEAMAEFRVLWDIFGNGRLEADTDTMFLSPCTIAQQTV